MIFYSFELAPCFLEGKWASPKNGRDHALRISPRAFPRQVPLTMQIRNLTGFFGSRPKADCEQWNKLDIWSLLVLLKCNTRSRGLHATSLQRRRGRLTENPLIFRTE